MVIIQASKDLPEGDEADRQLSLKLKHCLDVVIDAISPVVSLEYENILSGFHAKSVLMNIAIKRSASNGSNRMQRLYCLFNTDTQVPKQNR